MQVLVYVDNLRHWASKAELCIENIKKLLWTLIQTMTEWIFHPYTARVMIGLTGLVEIDSR